VANLDADIFGHHESGNAWVADAFPSWRPADLQATVRFLQEQIRCAGPETGYIAALLPEAGFITIDILGEGSARLDLANTTHCKAMLELATALKVAMGASFTAGPEQGAE